MNLMRTRSSDGSELGGLCRRLFRQRASLYPALWTAACLTALPITGRASGPYFFPDNLTPPPAGLYASTGAQFAAYANGVVLRNAAQRLPSASVPPPPPKPGEFVTHAYSCLMELELSLDGGATFTPVVAPAETTVRLTFLYLSGAEEVCGGETLALSLAPVPGLLVRESPTLASAGQTRLAPVPGGYVIDSFFDIYTEISTDGGLSWLPALEPSRVLLLPDPAFVPTAQSPLPLTPMPNGRFTASQSRWQSYPGGTVLIDADLRRFSNWAPIPAPGVPQSVAFGSQMTFRLSTDGGATWSACRAPAAAAYSLQSIREFEGVTSYDAELTQLDIMGGDLPPGVMIRESPTRASRGAATLSSGGGGGGGGGGYAVSSFFDIFTEISTDGGATWAPSTDAPVRMALSRVADAHAFESDLQPTPCGRYVSLPPEFAAYAPGVVVSSIVFHAFSKHFPPPPLGESATHVYESEAELQISLDGGGTYQRALAGASHAVHTTARLDGGAGTTYFDTEMLQLNLSGSGLPGGLMIRESPTRASLGRTTVTASGLSAARDAKAPLLNGGGGGYQIDSFFDIYTEISTDGGLTWFPALGGAGTVLLFPPEPLVLTCPADITVRAPTRAGATVVFPPPTATGGCPPVTVLCSPPSGSFFPLGVTVVSCLATDICDNVATGAFTVTVLRPLRKRYYEQQLMPPLGGLYAPPEPQTVSYGGGLYLRNVALRLFSASVAPPALLGESVTHAFSATAELELSADGGVTWQPCVADAAASLRLTNDGPDGGDTLHDAELLGLSASGGTLPAGVLIRESPTLASAGETRIESLGGGYQIDSFFDIFTEVSTDGGATWSPAAQTLALELKPDPALVEANHMRTCLEPPPSGKYECRRGCREEYPTGIITRDTQGKLAASWLPMPAPGSGQTQTTSLLLDFDLSLDGGLSWAPVRAPATMTFSSLNERQFSGRATFDTTMTQLDVAGGDLPAGLRIRESPTRASLGGSSLAASGGGYDISSFFDIYTEVSTDGGASWHAPTSGVLRLTLARAAPSHDYATNLQPPPDSRCCGWGRTFAGYAPGIQLSNLVMRSYTSSAAPPAPGATASHTCGARIETEISLDGGATWSHASAPATLTVQATCRTGGDGVTEHYDTEMVQLDADGGSLPASVRIRESPTRASLGRTTSSSLGGGYQVDSFFDIYTEVSTDGGMSWQVTMTGPGTLTQEPDPPLQLTAPRDITVAATNWNGRAVNYPPPAVSGGVPPVTVTCAPPSGSVFPVGQTRVVCTAGDFAGQTNTCSFLVTVLGQPELDDFPNSVARLRLQVATGGGETVYLVGPTRMDVYVGLRGECGDSDGDGRDDAAAELSACSLRGYSALLGSHVTVRNAAGARTQGQHEEQANATPGTLDVPPFAHAGMCDSFFDVFFEIDTSGQTLHPAAPLRVSAVISHKPPAPGERYVASLQQVIPLLDPLGQPTPYSVTGFEYTPATSVEVDPFPAIDTYVALRLPSGRTESVRLTGSALAQVYFEGALGQATDNDCDGLDDAIQSLQALELSGVCSAGPITLKLAPQPLSLGQLEERVNATPGELDVPPFQAVGDCDSFFDVFYLWAVGGQTLHNAAPWRLSATITHKPPAAGELFESPFETAVDFYDEWGALTLGRLTRQWLVLTPPDLDIAPDLPSMRVTWPSPSAGYQLECCSNLTPPSVWQTLPVTPIIGPDGRKTVWLDASGSNVFFRLRRALP